jgi:arylsulfatase A-like enzyme
MLRRLLAAALLPAVAAAAEPRPPNFVVILADDLGYADLGCYGNTRVATPHLDRMAREGLRFTDFHANGPMCSPTRAALLTGRYPHRVGIETALPLMAFPAKREGLPAATATMAQRLAAAGYATGMVGKWHLGHHPDENPVRFGFGEFRGLLCGDGDFAAQISRNGLPDWWENETLRPEPVAKNTTAAITDHAIGFLKRHRARPFFLYVAHLGIHFPWMRPDDPAHRRLGTRYVGVKNPADSKLGPHVGSAEMQSVVHAMIADLDAGVGRLLAALREHGLEENTLVVFTSDNGGYVHYDGLHRGELSDNGPFRDGKTTVYEGGHRVPTLVRWPGRIPADAISAATAATFDLAPTFLALAGVASPTAAFDGIDLSAHLLRAEPLPPRPLFWRIRGSRAVRAGDWKLIAPRGAAAELYNLAADPGETADRAAHEPTRVRDLQAALTAWEREVAAAAPQR